MKDILMCGYLLVLSIQDMYQQKISLYLLVFAMAGGGVYGLVQQRGWWIFLDILPGIALCVIAFIAPKTLGMGDGMVGMIYGLFYGGYQASLCLMWAFILAAAVGVVWCIGKGKRKIQIPFIPFISVVHVVMQL